MMKSKFWILLAIAASAFASDSSPVIQAYEPLTPGERLDWFEHLTFGPGAVLNEGIGAAIATGRDTPKEYGPHWDGFGRRVGLAAADNALSSAMELGLGGIWHEDPRYFRVPERRTSARIANVIRMTFVSHNYEGKEMPAYARFISAPASAFILTTWHPPSENSTGDALDRIGSDFLSRMTGNAFKEFWPDVKRKVFHTRTQSSDDAIAPVRSFR